MADWKYVMLRHEGQSEADCRSIPIIFPNLLVHSDVRDLMSRAPIFGQRRRIETVSAGFINMMASGVHGRSESLGDLESRPSVDRAIINLMPYSNGLDSAMLAIEPMMLMKHVELCLARIKELNDD